MQDNLRRSVTSDDLKLDEGVVHQEGTGSIVPEEEVGDALLHHRQLAPGRRCGTTSQVSTSVYPKYRHG